MAGGVVYYVQGTWGPGADNLDLQHVEVLNAPSLGSQSVTLEKKTNSAGLVLPKKLPILSSCKLPDGRFVFHVQGSPRTSYQLEYSSDLVHWQTLQTGVLTNGDQEVVDPEANTVATRFYRLH